MTMRELSNAIDGYNEDKKEQSNEYWLGVRRICFHVLNAAGAKVKREEDVFEMEIDRQIKKQRYADLKPTTVTVIPKQ
jgi:hypothetical protein